MTEERVEASESSESAFEVRRLLGFLRRMRHHWPTFLLALALSAGVAGALALWFSPAYRSETVILYSQGVSSVDPTEQGAPRNATARLKELLFSRRELSRIVNRFGLYPAVRESYGIEDAVDELKRHVEFRAPGGDTFSIAFQGGSPGQARDVTAALAKLVIDGDAALRKTQLEFVRNFLVAEKTSKADVLREAEQRLASFMAEHKRFALDTTPLAAGAAIRATLAGAAPAASAPSRWSRAPASSPELFVPVRPAPLGAGQPVPNDGGERARAVAALAAARANLTEQLGRLTPAHPDVRAAQGAVERATARLQALGPEPAAPVVQPVPARPRPAPPVAAAARTDSGAPVVVPLVAPATDKAPAEGGEDLVKLETEWLKLTRAVTEARQRLDQVESALFKADIQANSERSGSGVQISVIDPAFLPQRPIGMPRMAIVLGCLGVGCVLGLLAVALRAASDDRILEQRDLEETASTLVEVPRLLWRRRFHGAG